MSCLVGLSIETSFLTSGPRLTHLLSVVRNGHIKRSVLLCVKMCFSLSLDV